MKTIQFIFIFALAGLMFNCSPKLSPFTQQLQEENGWSKDDLERIQFYVSRDIVLQRNFKSGESKIENGKVRLVNGRKVEEVIITKGTPGVLVLNPRSDRMAISFEDGNDEKYLMFGPNPKYGDRYVLLAKEWQKKGGVITYDGRPFYTTSSSAYSALMIDLKKVGKTKVSSRVAKGRKL